MDKTHMYLAELIMSQLEDRMPRPLPKRIDAETLFDISGRAQMNYVILGALIKLDIPEEQKEWMRPHIKASICQTLTQMNCLREITKRLEEAGVKYQVMKGAILKHLYPSPGLREMGDIDIHIFDSSLDRAGRIAREMGFLLEESVKHHDVYVKPPFLILELHNALYDKQVDTNQFEYFKNHGRLKKSADGDYGYELSPEDFYIYMISHMAKHFYETGCGIRNLMDIYVYNKTCRQKLDDNYLKKELKACGTYEFERQMRKLAFDWLGFKKLSDFQDNLLEYMISAGIYGKDENGVWNKMVSTQTVPTNRQMLKLWYCLPPVAYLVHDYPVLAKHKWLLPFIWLYRGVHGMILGSSEQKLKMMQVTDIEEIRKKYEIYAKMQLNFKDTQN